MDARTVPRVHRFEVIQEDLRRPGTSLSTASRRDCTYRSEADGAELRRTLRQRNAEEDVTWVHSYVSDTKRRTSCVYEAPFPKGIRKAAGRNDLPAGRVTRVRVPDPYSYM
jgi:Protein of unknown function (DUF4242)